MNRGSEWLRWDLHVHTASSYDHKYKSEDSNQILVDAWKRENISLVAITDHFIIDSDRILKLREMAPDITILPGVELRCDKGTANLHIIIIFLDDNIEELANDFKVVMVNRNAKSKDHDSSIYWDFNDIVNYAKENNGVITIHAGKKDKGLDDGISNKLDANIAIKQEISDNIDIFEMSRLRDLDDYNKHVFNTIKNKPMIICSDNHDPREYQFKEKLWVKAEPSYNGLVQAIKEPKLRFYVGDMPPKLKVINDNKEKFIDSIEIKGIDENKKWFNQSLKLSSDLVTIIGNKGNGKSALADIIGHAGNSQNYKYFSFLSENRFNPKDNRLGLEYKSSLKWKNGHEESKSLYPIDNSKWIEKVKCLPQQYIEKVCNDLENGFNEEIERIIFDYLPTQERFETNSLNKLLEYLTKNLNIEISEYNTKLQNLNSSICDMEKSSEEANLKKLELSIKDIAEQLKLELKNISKEFPKPEQSKVQEAQINDLNATIEELKKIIEIKNDLLIKLNKKAHTIKASLDKIEKAKISFNTWLEKINLELKEEEITTLVSGEFTINHEELTKLSKSIKNQIVEIKKDISNKEQDGEDGIIIKRLKEEENKLSKIIGTLSKVDLEYQNSIQEQIKWKEKVDNKSKELEKQKERLRVLMEDIPKKLEELFEERKCIVRSIYKCQEKVVDIYEQKYLNVNETINKLQIVDLEKPKIEIEFKIDIELMEQILFRYINHNVKSMFMGKEQARNKLSEMIETVEGVNFDSIYDMLNRLEIELKEGADKVFKDKKEFLNELYSLKYMSTSYNLKLGDKMLSQLSPGERGLVLLIFYLVLDKDQLPLIIDQPEDNLDNQSIYNKLVPYIIMAKERRQIIIVTHNPNIAIACDSEQIIYSKMNKSEMEIIYRSGAIEEKDTNDSIIDVLEGTMPAFDKRRERYKL
ncbi:hypothetical protein H7E67_15390 [Clostridium gasigenes]|uniref:TrlF family AAA-like ATPase n=1 Tax=Clostridium gasigenes TaxID=94869 RepID=UPI00162A21EF|nr:hypothetical protein [Clostridium gasigenes]MBB6624823.1 hypothetical protein [Clostridium gasigenes]